MYRYISRESCSQFDSLPLTSLTSDGVNSFALSLMVFHWMQRCRPRPMLPPLRPLFALLAAEDGALPPTSLIYRYISRESCSQFDSLPLTYLTYCRCAAARLRDRRVRRRAGALRGERRGAAPPLLSLLRRRVPRDADGRARARKRKRKRGRERRGGRKDRRSAAVRAPAPRRRARRGSFRVARWARLGARDRGSDYDGHQSGALVPRRNAQPPRPRVPPQRGRDGLSGPCR